MEEFPFELCRVLNERSSSSPTILFGIEVQVSHEPVIKGTSCFKYFFPLGAGIMHTLLRYPIRGSRIPGSSGGC
jgi:hypothetical protein